MISALWDSQKLLATIGNSIVKYSDLRSTYLNGVNKYNLSHLEDSLNLSIKTGWVLLRSEELHLTQMGQNVANLLPKDNRPCVSAARVQLMDFIAVEKPFWSYYLKMGRKESIPFMSAEIADVFYQLKLINEDDRTPDRDAIEWWDKISAAIYSDDQYNRIRIGRLGEYCSYLYEIARVGEEPQWTALESNKAGYDLLSRRARGKDSKLCIEVKTCTSKPQSFFLSKNEWSVASSKRSGEYMIHFWDICHPENPLLHIISPSRMIEMMPTDGIAGEWVNCKVEIAKLENILLTPIGYKQLPKEVVKTIKDSNR
ncbi:MAG: DUF3883 domain-containing protein [Candidatus Marinimicrobia bacterium]|jgi:hypothetical protein|nr:DUF3883 domain-containing protein [Candidatus Neomarinimicrobiota bacterium]